MTDYASLYENTYETQRQNAVYRIKEVLSNKKTKGLPFNTHINFLINEFYNEQTTNIVNENQYRELNNEFSKRVSNFGEIDEFQVFKNKMEPLFNSLENNDLGFSTFIENLAKKEAYSRTINLFRNYDTIFEMMYKIQKFEGYEKLPDFDVRMFNNEPSYYDLKQEISALAYPKEKKIEEKSKSLKKDKTITPPKNPFTFLTEYIPAMRSKKVYSLLEGEYFNDLETNHDIYLAAFFENPYHQDSNIRLDCNTKLFARLISEMKKQLFKKVSYKDIERCQLFKTEMGNNLTANNITNSAKNATDAQISIVNTTISNIKKFSDSLKS